MYQGVLIYLCNQYHRYVRIQCGGHVHVFIYRASVQLAGCLQTSFVFDQTDRVWAMLVLHQMFTDAYTGLNLCISVVTKADAVDYEISNICWSLITE